MSALRAIALSHKKLCPNIVWKHNKLFSTEVVKKQPEEIKIPVPWGHIAGVWWGPVNQVPVLALHGWQDNAGTWDNLFPLLDPELSVLALDTPGHGLSSHLPPGIPYYGSESVVYLRRILKHFGWKRISLLGHSFGAAQGFMYASTFPDSVENYIAIDALKPWSLDMSREPKKLASNIDRFLDLVALDEAATPAYSYEESVQRLYEGMIENSLTKEATKLLLKRGLTSAPNGKYYYSRDKRLKVGRFLGWTHEQILEMAASISCRVLFIKALPGITLEPSHIIEETCNTINKSSKEFIYKTVEGTHHVHLNNAERIAPIINEFLAVK